MLWWGLLCAALATATWSEQEPKPGEEEASDTVFDKPDYALHKAPLSVRTRLSGPSGNAFGVNFGSPATPQVRGQ